MGNKLTNPQKKDFFNRNRSEQRDPYKPLNPQFEPIVNDHIVVQKKKDKKKKKKNNDEIKHVASFFIENDGDNIKSTKVPLTSAEKQRRAKNGNIWLSKDENLRANSTFKISYMGSNSNRQDLKATSSSEWDFNSATIND